MDLQTRNVDVTVIARCMGEAFVCWFTASLAVSVCHGSHIQVKTKLGVELVQVIENALM